MRYFCWRNSLHGDSASPLTFWVTVSEQHQPVEVSLWQRERWLRPFCCKFPNAVGFHKGFCWQLRFDPPIFYLLFKNFIHVYVWSSSYSFLSSSFFPSHPSLFSPDFVCSLFLSSFTLWVYLVLPECASVYDCLPEPEQCLRSCIPEENCFSARGGTYWSPPCSWLGFVCLGFLHISHGCYEFIGTVSLLCLEAH